MSRLGTRVALGSSGTLLGLFGPRFADLAIAAWLTSLRLADLFELRDPSLISLEARHHDL